MLSKNLFDEKALEVNAISNYLTADTPLPQYLPYARFLLDTDLSHTAKLLYTLLLDRATLSQKNNWMDECGFVYVIFPLSSLSDALRCSTMSIKRALRSLEDADLIERRRGHIAVPNNIFVKVPTEQKCSSAWNDSAPCDGTEMIPSIANALMEQEVPVRMTNFVRILNELNNSFSGRNDIVDKLCCYPLLVIDDFGMERGTEYALEQIYNIVDSRYRSRKPLIVTTNLTLDEIRHPQDTAHARIYDRLLEMCVPISCIGVSFRKENAQEKLERLKSLIG